MNFFYKSQFLTSIKLLHVSTYHQFFSVSMHLAIGLQNTHYKLTSKLIPSNMITKNSAKVTENNTTVWIIIGIAIPTLIVLTTIAIIALVLFVRRKFLQQKTECDNSYSTLSRGPTQQLQPQSLHTPNDL